MRESQLQSKVVALIKELGLRSWHCVNMRGSQPGWPDLVIFGPKGVIFRELKTNDGIVKPEQREWGAVIRKSGCDWDVWRTRDWETKRILGELINLR